MEEFAEKKDMRQLHIKMGQIKNGFNLNYNSVEIKNEN
jgi:hypothetical protein